MKPEWMDGLTEGQLNHLKSIGCQTLAQVSDIRTQQKKLYPNQEICEECHAIARKLGLEK
jgi:hypothetical protein